MGAKKIIFDLKQVNAKLRVASFRASLEAVVGVLCTRHASLDATIYVQDCGTHGFRAVKFYSDGLDMRVGSFQESAELSLREAVQVL